MLLTMCISDPKTAEGQEDDQGVLGPSFGPCLTPLPSFPLPTKLTSAGWVRTAVAEQVGSRAKGLRRISIQKIHTDIPKNFCKIPLIVAALPTPVFLP